MRASRLLVVIFASVSLAPVLTPSSLAQSVITRFSFSGANGANPIALTQGRDGALYGATTAGGAQGMGTVFRIGTNGKMGIIYNFSGPDGSGPSGLALASDGNFYGTTGSGGSFGLGVLFKITNGGALTVLHHFSGGSDGSHPGAPPIQAADSNLYGSTVGAFSENSTIYKFTSSGTFSTILSISSIVGADLHEPLLFAQDGTLIALAYTGGGRSCGSILKVTTSGLLKGAFSFNCGTTGAEPTGLVQTVDSTFYGTTYAGGTLGFGTIYHLDNLGAITTVYNFGNLNDGALPGFGLTLASDGNYYGATTSLGPLGSGTAFDYSIAAGYAELFSFPLVNGALTGPNGPTQHTSGAFYGVTVFGGTYGLGSVYSFDVGLAPYIALQEYQGRVGNMAWILGQGLTGTTDVTFDGVPAASFKVVTDTFMTAVVPSGATTGKVVVTTPGGPLTSNVNFRILH